MALPLTHPNPNRNPNYNSDANSNPNPEVLNLDGVATHSVFVAPKEHGREQGWSSTSPMLADSYQMDAVPVPS